MRAATTSCSDQLQLLYNVSWMWGIRNDCNVLLLEPPVCNSQHSTHREPERCWLCEPDSSMALIRSQGNLCALSSPMVTWIMVSHPPPPASRGLLTPPTPLTHQSSFGCTAMAPKVWDRCGQLPFTPVQTYLRPAARTAGLICSATRSTPHFPYASLRRSLVSKRKRVRLSA